MKRNTLLVLGALCISIAGVSVAASNAATEHQHAHGTTAALQLNAGQKWETDAALRQSMGSIRQKMTAALPEIHNNRLPKAGYAQLATTVESEVSNIVANCKLSPKADEQLHLIVAELLEGAGQMAGKEKNASRQQGAIRVIGALEKYETYFDDAGFKPVKH